MFILATLLSALDVSRPNQKRGVCLFWPAAHNVPVGTNLRWRTPPASAKKATDRSMAEKSYQKKSKNIMSFSYNGIFHKIGFFFQPKALIFRSSVPIGVILRDKIRDKIRDKDFLLLKRKNEDLREKRDFSLI